MDLGIEDVDDAPGYFSDKFPEYGAQISEFWKHIEDIVGEYDYSAPLIRSLKEKGYRVYLLSNYPDKLADMHWSRFSFLKELDGYIVSAKVKLAKPDRAIYELLLNKYGLTAGECVFIDDRQDNVDAAIEVGMKGILFTGYDELMQRPEMKQKDTR